MALPFIFVSPYLSDAIVTFILYFSGPILFFLISSLNISEKTRKKIDFYFLIVLGTICILNVLFYFVQDKILEFVDSDDLKNFDRNGKIRFLGIALHPTSTGFFFIYFTSYLFIYERDKICSFFWGIFFLLTGTRSAILGLPFYMFLKFKRLLKILSLVFGVAILFLIYVLLMAGTLNAHLDSSALKHLMDLFVLGPEYVQKYPFGAGLGTVSPYNQENAIIHIESETYLYMIQLGIFAFIIKMIFYFFVIKKLLLINNRKTNWLLFILLTFMVGCMVFALNDTRFISNFIWIMLGIEFSKSEYKKLSCNKDRKHPFLKYFLRIRN